MHIDSIEIFSYKSFRQSGLIKFDKGVNLVVGVNNSGKTSLLEALSQKFENKPFVNDSHSARTGSLAETTFLLTREDLPIEKAASGQIIMPSFSESNSINAATWMLKKALEDDFRVRVRSNPDSPMSLLQYPYKNTVLQPMGNAGVLFDLDKDNRILGSGQQRGGFQPFVDQLIKQYISRIFRFSGERMQIHTSELYASPFTLQSNASNLAACLRAAIDSNAPKYRRDYVGLVSRVLPAVKYVHTDLLPKNQLTIRIWPRDPETSDTSYLLSESGTGVGQVLAILYVIVYADPSVIIIDEPNSFLHPAATRELLRIFRENSQHQYFISTHSPEVFAELKPAFYTSLTYDGETKTSRESFGNLVTTYQELGISPFFEKSLWVEGETEVEAFKRILKDPNLQIFKFDSATELGRSLNKKADMDRLIRVHSNMVAARNGEPTFSKVRVVVDGEHLGPRTIEDYQRRSDKFVHFLSRQMFENYLLDADAIACVVSNAWGHTVEAVTVQRYLDEDRGKQTETSWLRTAHGGRLLEKIFSEVTDAACQFRKTTHSIELTEYLLSEKPKHFDEIRELVTQAFSD